MAEFPLADLPGRQGDRCRVDFKKEAGYGSLVQATWRPSRQRFVWKSFHASNQRGEIEEKMSLYFERGAH